MEKPSVGDCEERTWSEFESFGPENSSKITEDALAFCHRYDLPVIPPIFELAFLHVQGASPGVSTAIRAILDHGPLTCHAALELHDRFVHTGRALQQMTGFSNDLGREISTVNAAVRGEIDSCAENNRRLTGLTNSLSSSRTLKDALGLARTITKLSREQAGRSVHMAALLCDSHSRIRALETEIAKHVQEANTDHLTGLPNRRAFDSFVSEQFSRRVAQPDDGEGALGDFMVLIDLDHFKSLNDNYGHDTGDNILSHFAGILKASEPKSAMAARWGGEEFCLYLPQVTNAGVRKICEKIRAGLARINWCRKSDSKHIGQVTCSLGATVRLPCDTADGLFERVDGFLYEAKNAGRNLVNLDGEILTRAAETEQSSGQE